MNGGLASLYNSSGPGGGGLCHWRVFDRAFSADECTALVALFEAQASDEGALVAGQFSAAIRRSSLVWLPETDEWDWAHQRMARLVADANRDVFRFALDGFEERLQLAAYGPGHFYDWHIDRGQGSTAGRRKLTVSVQLTPPEDYEGGALELNADGHPFQAPLAQGTAVSFASNTLHRVAPITRGMRHSLVAWVHGPAFT